MFPIAAIHSKINVQEDKSYLGRWVTADGYIRQELLHNGHYDEARGDTPMLIRASTV